MASFYSKRYVDRAIQTDSGRSPRSRTQSFVPSHSQASIESFSGSNFSSSSDPLGEQQTAKQGFANSYIQLGTQDADNAYTQSWISETTEDAISSSRLACKQAGIGCGWPSEQISPTKRMASLPNISSTGDTLDRQTRIVSMPERNKLGNLELPVLSGNVQADTSDSTGIGDYSMDSGQLLTRQKFETARLYPVDLPQTPSPPSSPESVMIIGNEGQVSGSFLRRSCTDEDGWITWASSPPRPIPALHGPLSLPYARCPSGAEGTVIEGDDLSNKIWGLCMQDDMQSQNSRSVKTPVNQVLRQQGISGSSSATLQQPPSQDTTVPQASFQRGRDTVIDLSRPLVFRSHADLLGAPRKYAYELDQQCALRSTVSRDVPVGLSARRNSDTHYSSLPETFNSQHTRLPENLLRGNEPFLAPPLGLGLNWNGGLPSSKSGNSSGFNSDLRSRLNTAAPVFVPGQRNGTNKIPSNVYAYPPANNAGIPNARHRDALSRANAASQYRTQQDHDLRTPTITSPLWSSAFVQSHEADMQKSGHSRYNQQNPMQYGPKVYSPQLDVDDYANRLRVMMEQLRADDFDYSTARFTPMDRFPVQKNVPMAQSNSGRAFKHSSMSPGQNEAARTPQIKPISHELILDHETEQSAHAMDANDIPFSSERRRNLSYQHPRSIPLARLIQRRLSSVAEEDAERDSLLPLLRKRASELPVMQHLARESTSSQSRGIDDGENTHGRAFMDTQENIESAVTRSVQDSPIYPGDSSAVVNLPKSATAAYSACGLGKGSKSVRNNAGSKENMCGSSTYSTVYTNQNKQKFR